MLTVSRSWEGGRGGEGRGGEGRDLYQYCDVYFVLGCKFQEYIERHHYDTEAPNLSLFSPPTGSSEEGVDTDDLFSDSYSDNYNSGVRMM